MAAPARLLGLCGRGGGVLLVVAGHFLALDHRGRRVVARFAQPRDRPAEVGRVRRGTGRGSSRGGGVPGLGGVGGAFPDRGVG